jgi:putative transposase
VARQESRFADPQIAFALQQADSGVPVEEVFPQLGITQQTSCRWHLTYGRLAPEMAKELTAWQ